MEKSIKGVQYELEKDKAQEGVLSEQGMEMGLSCIGRS